MRSTKILTAVLGVSLVWFGTHVAAAAESEFVQPADGPAVLPSTPELDQRWPQPPDIGAMLTRLAVTTVVILAVCVGTLWFGRKWLAHTTQAGNATEKQIVIRETVALDGRSRLHLVQVDQCRVLVATDTTGLKSVTALPDSFDDVLASQQEEPAAKSSAATLEHENRTSLERPRPWELTNRQFAASEVSHV